MFRVTLTVACVLVPCPAYCCCPQITHMADTELRCTSVQHWPTLDSSVPLNWEIGIGRGSNYETQSKINEPSSQQITGHWSICQAVAGLLWLAPAVRTGPDHTFTHWQNRWLQLFSRFAKTFDLQSESWHSLVIVKFPVKVWDWNVYCELWFMLQHTISGVLRESIEKSHIGADLWNCHECYESLPQLS